jgi:hypothetical protein
MALDETRKPFTPTLWELPQGHEGKLTQVWFPGVHSDVGGSYDDTRSADITLAWMVSQLSDYITFDRELLKGQYYKPREDEAAQWSCGTLSHSVPICSTRLVVIFCADIYSVSRCIT